MNVDKAALRNGRTGVCLFAKAPLQGAVKTRMAPLLSESDCLRLHRELLTCVIENAASLPMQDYAVELHITSPHTDFDTLSARHGFPQKLQRGADLGERMSYAVAETLRCHPAVLLLGADCPFVDSKTIDAMQQALQHSQAVIVPATDGGYVALMLRAHDASLFENIAWGGDDVAAVTRCRLQALKWTYTVMPVCRDIDRPEDLECLAQIPALQHWAAVQAAATLRR